MKNFLKLIFFIIGINTTALAQQQPPDITGLWKGELYVDSTKQYLPYEIAVSEGNKGKLTGFSRIIFYEDGKEEPGFENITLEWEGNKLIIKDEGFFEHAFSKKPSKRVKKEMTLSLIISDTAMVLKGKWQTNRTRYYLVATGTTFLTRKKDFQETALYKKLDSLNLAPKLSFAQPEKLIAAKEPPKETPKIEPVKVEPVEPEIEILSLAPIDKPAVAMIPVSKTKQPSTLKVEAPSKQKKQFYASLTKMSIAKPKEPEVAVVEKKPPVVVTKPAPAPVKEKAPDVAKASPTKEVKKSSEDPDAAATVKVVQPPPPQPKLPEPSKQAGAAEIEKRVTKSDQSFYFDTDSLLLTLYDNGEVDGDTVTVLMNGSVIFSKVGLTTRANSKTIYITPNMDSVSLVMYAESLGEIPPNTGLLIVNDGEKRYDVRFSADLKTNAGIVLRRRKKE